MADQDFNAAFTLTLDEKLTFFSSTGGVNESFHFLNNILTILVSSNLKASEIFNFNIDLDLAINAFLSNSNLFASFGIDIGVAKTALKEIIANTINLETTVTGQSSIHDALIINHLFVGTFANVSASVSKNVSFGITFLVQEIFNGPGDGGYAGEIILSGPEDGESIDSSDTLLLP